MTIYLVKKLWTDSMENHAGDAFGYLVVGYVTDPIVAERIAANSPIVDGSECWAISTQKLKRFVIERVKEVRESDFAVKEGTDK